ncbi:hypothetical protein [Paraburkholderia fungorum]|jgi:hypothetical protein|uniref:hypothetical protein n=1 Tax=Paraburkholderia fungorum TaxID=134537 RepID=UPI000D048CC5|nr:hypothetical protein [Paraburkholderia fungorum]PRZ48166.1 hypothetical protein BX589_128122 [Paraburkholderia fungorum]
MKKNKTLYTWAWNCEQSGYTHVNTAQSLREIVDNVLSLHVEEDYDIEESDDTLKIRVEDCGEYIVKKHPYAVSDFLETIFHELKEGDQVAIEKITI